MDIRVVGSTKPGFRLPIEDAVQLEECTSYNLVLSGIPKIIAMILGNEEDCDILEQTEYYDFNLVGGYVKYLYDKWSTIFQKQIAARYPRVDEVTRAKLARYNASYFISAFTPSMTIKCTVSLQQGNNLIRLLENSANLNAKDGFRQLLNPALQETAELFKSVIGVDGFCETSETDLSLFAKREREEYFGETYSTNYLGSFAMLALAQSYNDLHYEMFSPDSFEADFYIPPIIDDTLLAYEYFDDIESVQDTFPQGMLLYINERGTPEAFLNKCSEQLCGLTQLEFCDNIHETLKRYVNAASRSKNLSLYRELGAYLGKPKCQSGQYKCDRPCPLGPKNVFTRKI